MFSNTPLIKVLSIIARGEPGYHKVRAGGTVDVWYNAKRYVIKMPAHYNRHEWLKQLAVAFNTPELGGRFPTIMIKTPGEIIDYFETHPETTLKQFHNMTNHSMAYLKGLLNHPDTVEA